MYVAFGRDVWQRNGDTFNWENTVPALKIKLEDRETLSAAQGHAERRPCLLGAE